MRYIFLWCLLPWQISQAQPGFNNGYDYNYYFNYFNDVAVYHDTITAYGLAQDTAWPYQQGLLIAQFDTFGNRLRNVLILDTTNNIYAIDKGWGKITATSDGGYAMTTAVLYGRDAVFIKLTRDLKLEFVQRYRDTINLGEFLEAPIEIPEGYLLYGYYQRAGNGKHDALIRKVDKQGNLIWRKNYGDSLWYESFNRAVPYQDSLILLSGLRAFDVLDPGTSKPWVSVFNREGILKWHWTSSFNDDFQGINLGSFFPQTDSTWLTFGSRYLGIHPVYGYYIHQRYCIGLDKNFHYMWSKPYGPTQNKLDVLLQFIRCSNGDIVGIGQRGPYNFDTEGFYQKGWVMRFNAQGDSLWDWAGKIPIPNAGAHFFSGGALLSSGSIVAAGQGEDANGHWLGWIVKMSPDGCVDTLYCHGVSGVEAPEPSREGLRVWPNPAHRELNIAFPVSSRACLISLFDLNGRRVSHTSAAPGLGNITLDISGLQQGVYFLQIADKQQTVQFIVNHN